jgi:hypothetical protein
MHSFSWKFCISLEFLKEWIFGIFNLDSTQARPLLQLIILEFFGILKVVNKGLLPIQKCHCYLLFPGLLSVSDLVFPRRVSRILCPVLGPSCCRGHTALAAKFLTILNFAIGTKSQNMINLIIKVGLLRASHKISDSKPRIC